ncbi:hypothetical protein [Nocardioides pyridinolyticus]
MALARREVLGLGAALALSSAAAACGASDQQRHPASAPPSSSPAATELLPPAPGRMYYGASVPFDRSVPAWEQELGAVLAVHRSYFGTEADEADELVAQCRLDQVEGRLPHVSIKPRSTWRDVASGTRDDWLTGMLRPLAELGSAVILTVHHEPENDAGRPGMEPPDYVAMQEHVIEVAARIAPRVLVAPVLQHWTFEPLRDDADPSVWIVPGAAVFGIDVYNPWSPTNGKSWRSLGSKLDEAAPWIGDRPIVIGEYGSRNDPSNPTLGAEWLRDAAEYALTHGVISMSYYNSGDNAPDGSWALAGAMEAAFADLLASTWVARA